MGWFIGNTALGQAWRSPSNLEVFNPRWDTALKGVWGRTRRSSEALVTDVLLSGHLASLKTHPRSRESSSPRRTKPGRRLQC